MQSSTLRTRVANYIETQQLFPIDGQVVVAVSGGADSLCLLHILQRLCGPDGPFPMLRLQAAHLDHMLRGAASQRDAEALRQLLAAWQVPLLTKAFDVPALARAEKRSLEDAARLARYRFLRSIAQGSPIAVAHHADDQVETILLHWLRGSGLSGLVGMLPRQQGIVRPLLEITQAEIDSYCHLEGIKPLEDASNRDPRFLRNRVRHELLPLLESLNPGIRETLRRNAEVLRTDLDWLEAEVEHHWPFVVIQAAPDLLRLNHAAFQRLPPAIQHHLLRRATANLCGGQSPLEPRHFALLDQLESSLDLPGQLRARRIANELRIERRIAAAFETELAAEREHNQELLLSVPGSGRVPGTHWRAEAKRLPSEIEQAAIQALQRSDWATLWQLLPREPQIAYIDGSSLGPTLRVRTRQPGDRLQPLGMSGLKKVQDILVDRHIPRTERETLPLFYSEGQCCLWLAGVCLDERVSLSSATQQIVRLAISRDANVSHEE